MLTCYDASFAALLDAAGVDSLLVGDSLGMVLQGRTSTLPCHIEDMAYHTACVARGNRTAWLIADMPFGSYQDPPSRRCAAPPLLMQAGAHMVKLEGGGWTAPIVRFLVERGVPVCAHLGLTPQSVHALGGYRVQGRDEAAARPLASGTREDSPRRARRCWCWKWCRRRWPRDLTRDPADSDHRHRRRRAAAAARSWCCTTCSA